MTTICDKVEKYDQIADKYFFYKETNEPFEWTIQPFKEIANHPANSITTPNYSHGAKTSATLECCRRLCLSLGLFMFYAWPWKPS